MDDIQIGRERIKREIGDRAKEKRETKNKRERDRMRGRQKMPGFFLKILLTKLLWVLFFFFFLIASLDSAIQFPLLPESQGFFSYTCQSSSGEFSLPLYSYALKRTGQGMEYKYVARKNKDSLKKTIKQNWPSCFHYINLLGGSWMLYIGSWAGCSEKRLKSTLRSNDHSAPCLPCSNEVALIITHLTGRNIVKTYYAPNKYLLNE